ncbi:hypothetical protein [Desulfohalovibrio reitneri]|uniref:hypothetical protein n=1 Tax=Desulfohalovibrio reitneri TaxID=1307759 RepID=UPI0004A76687|nr:hypothetical protein [Desulfohalovibrio reitneri]
MRLALPGIADGEARLAPLTGDGLEEGHWLVPSLADGSARLEDSDAPGFLYAVERGCRGGSYGFTRPFDPGAAWSAERHATADGKPITGRQSLPDVLVPDGSLCLGRLDDLARLEHGGGAGGARLLRLPPERSWAADTPLELLRRVVRRRMAEGGPDAG